MSGMMAEMIKKEMKNLIKKAYPHLQQPPAVLAKITKAKEEKGIYQVSLQVLDKSRKADSRIPEIPMVFTNHQVKKGDVVAVSYLYGDPTYPYILGRWVR